MNPGLCSDAMVDAIYKVCQWQTGYEKGGCFRVKGQRFMPLNELFVEISSKFSQMTTAEFVDLLKQTENPDEKEFYSVIFNTILQQQQRRVIEANKF